MANARKLLSAAREAIRASLESRPPRPFDPIRPAAPIFVTLRIDGALRGCMGSLGARFDDLVQEAMDRACAAAFDDPRFPALEIRELERCTIEVTILHPLEPATPEQLDPARFGVEVRDPDGRSAVLLPGIEGIETVERQLELVRRKAGIARGVAVSIRRFSVTRAGEGERADR